MAAERVRLCLGWALPRGVRSKVGDCSHSGSLLLMLGSGALGAHEECVN
jgi:hypothetical protein